MLAVLWVSQEAASTSELAAGLNEAELVRERVEKEEAEIALRAAGLLPLMKNKFILL